MPTIVNRQHKWDSYGTKDSGHLEACSCSLEAVGVQSKSIKSAWKRGYGFAKSIYDVRYKCSVCGGDMIIDTANEKKAAAKLMRESGWKHTSCG